MPTIPPPITNASVTSSMYDKDHARELPRVRQPLSPCVAQKVLEGAAGYNWVHAPPSLRGLQGPVRGQNRRLARPSLRQMSDVPPHGPEPLVFRTLSARPMDPVQ